jgi:hypothetical protein
LAVAVAEALVARQRMAVAVVHPRQQVDRAVVVVMRLMLAVMHHRQRARLAVPVRLALAAVPIQQVLEILAVVAGQVARPTLRARAALEPILAAATV